jgi:hypothetical protein
VTSVTRTPRELSIVCDEAAVPPGVLSERGFRALVIEGQIDFSMTGVVAAIAGPLAAASVSLFVVSTYDTDYVLVKDDRLDAAIAALQAAGLTVTPSQTR